MPPLLTYVTVSVTIRSESNLARKDAVQRHTARSGRGRCPRADLHSVPGRSGHHACRHYDRRARCVAGSGRGAGGVTPAVLALRPTKPGPDRTKGPYTPWEEPWWNAGRRARPTAEGRRKPLIPWRDPHPLVREVIPCVCRRSASLFLRSPDEAQRNPGAELRRRGRPGLRSAPSGLRIIAV